MRDRSPKLSRRGFVKRSGALLGAPLFAPACALGRTQRVAASERLTIGMIGMGRINTKHLSTLLKTPDVQVVAVCDVDTTRREHAQKTVDGSYSRARGAGKAEYRGCAAYNDHRELLARADIDAVVIGTPDHWHAISVIDACKAKKDIYCEKPLSLTIREAQVMIDAVRSHERVFQTGSQQRSEYNGRFRQACELVRNGRIGKVQSVFVGVGDSSRRCDLPAEELEPGLDWDRWLGQAPERPYNSILSPRGVHTHFPKWRHYREYSGGQFTDWGAHHFDIAQWGLGMDASGPVEVLPPEDPSATKGVTFLYENGVRVVHGGPSGVTFVGTQGMIFVTRGAIRSEPEKILEEPLGEDDLKLRRSPGHHRDWLDCIKSRERPICDIEIGARSVTVAHLGNLAYWNRRALRWDPKRWKFVGDAEADMWLDRERRDPYQLPSV